MKCLHTQIGDLDYNDSEMAEAISHGYTFQGDGVCLTCGALVTFTIVRQAVEVIPFLPYEEAL